MGRPLNKKYFGNRNVGTTATTDTSIGGEGVASVSITAAGSYTSALPTVSFSTPEIPTGVRATGTVHGKALSAVATAAGTGYTSLSNVLTQSTGGTGTMATWNVTGLTVVDITLNNGGSANDIGDEFTFAIAGFATPVRVRVTASSAGVATAVSIVNGGVWTAGALPTNSIGMTKTQVAAGSDYNGVGLEVNFTAWGVSTVAVATEGDYTTIASGAKATTVSPAGGTGATLTITYGVKSVAITEKGSGYISVADALPTFSSGIATGASVLTSDSGAVSGSTNQENAILITAYVPGGSSAVTGDIIKQASTRRYKVKTAQGTGIVKLVTTSPGAGEARITATDSDSGTYYVTKLTAHKALLTQGTGTQFATGTSVKWSFGAAVEDSSVQINNA